jgi:hypothetical protein
MRHFAFKLWKAKVGIRLLFQVLQEANPQVEECLQGLINKGIKIKWNEVKD